MILQGGLFYWLPQNSSSGRGNNWWEQHLISFVAVKNVSCVRGWRKSENTCEMTEVRLKTNKHGALAVCEPNFWFPTFDLPSVHLYVSPQLCGKESYVAAGVFFLHRGCLSLSLAVISPPTLVLAVASKWPDVELISLKWLFDPYLWPCYVLC